MEISILNTSGNIQSFHETHKNAADLFTYLLHQESVEPSRKAVFMAIVRDGDLPMANMTKEFAYHLINNMDEGERKQLELVQREDKGGFGIGNETLTDLVEMELVDPATSYRKWEYGKYALSHFIDGFHSSELPTNLGTKGIDDNTLLERFASNLANGQEPWEKFVQMFLVQALKHKLNPLPSNMAAYDLMGDLVQKNLVYLSIKMNPLRTAFKESLSLAMDQGKRRGPKR